MCSLDGIDRYVRLERPVPGLESTLLSLLQLKHKNVQKFGDAEMGRELWVDKEFARLSFSLAGVYIHRYKSGI